MSDIDITALQKSLRILVDGLNRATEERDAARAAIYDAQEMTRIVEYERDALRAEVDALRAALAHSKENEEFWRDMLRGVSRTLERANMWAEGQHIVTAVETLVTLAQKAHADAPSDVTMTGGAYVPASKG